MAAYTFASQPVYDPAPGANDPVVGDATGGKFVAAKDGPPLPIYDLNGTPLASLSSNSAGMSTAFTADSFMGFIQFGTLAVPVVAQEVAEFAVNAQDAVAVASSAAATASSASAAVDDALTRALKIGRPGASTPTWWGAFTSSNKPTPAEGVQLGDLGILLP